MTSLENSGLHSGSDQLSSEPSAFGGPDGDDAPASAIDLLLKRYDPPKEPSASASARQLYVDLLTRTIQRQILPKLALTHGADAIAAGRPHPASVIDEAELADFTTLVLANDLQAGTARLEKLVARGAALSDICLSVLTPTAQRLGIMWTEDKCTFVDVTAGLGTLHTIMYRLREICVPALPVRDPSRRILLASLAGNQHTFGLRMVSEVFRHAGWEVTSEVAAEEADLPGMVSGNWFAIAGISLSRTEQTQNLGQTIRAIRRASRNKAIGVLVGGPVFDAQPELAHLVGADVGACDAKQAVLRAEGLRLLMASLDQSADGDEP